MSYRNVQFLSSVEGKHLKPEEVTCMQTLRGTEREGARASQCMDRDVGLKSAGWTQIPNSSLAAEKESPSLAGVDHTTPRPQHKHKFSSTKLPLAQGQQ